MTAASKQEFLASLVTRVLDSMKKSSFSLRKLTEFSCCENLKNVKAISKNLIAVLCIVNLHKLTSEYVKRNRVLRN